MERIGDTKLLILESCIRPKSWSELSKIINRSDPTLTDHLKRLTGDRLLARDHSSGLYSTTEQGINTLREVPSAYFKNIVPANLMLAGIEKNLNSSDRLYRIFAELTTRGLLGKDAEAYYKAIAEAVISSVTIQTQSKANIDNKMFKLVNDLIGYLIKQGGMIEKGKLTINISVDFPKELDIRTRNESNPKIKEQLIQNRDMIINRTVPNWNRLFSKAGLLA
jgi:hypothetical protein